MKKEIDFRTYLKDYPDKNGYFGEYGGSFLPPQLVPVMEEITEAYNTICHSAKFILITNDIQPI